MLRFIGLSGTTNVTQNMYIYESDDDILILDCGAGFPDSDMFGVDLVIPDFSYLVKNKKNIRGIVITHGHEDHIGSLPFLIKEINVPIYATPLAAAFIKDKFEDHRIVDYKINIINPDTDIVRLGNFELTPFRISHSIPDGVGFAINTKDGCVFHVADYKFDWTPVTGHPFDIAKAARLAGNGVLALVSDSLGAMSPGYTESENKIEGKIIEIVRNVKGKVVFTTLSSNVSRIQMAINAAKVLGRKVSFVGLSIDKKARIARDLGYLDFKDVVVKNPKVLFKENDEKILFIVAGAYGQVDSALARVAYGEHSFLKLTPNDRVIFSADPAPPGTKEAVDNLVDRLVASEIEVNYYDTQEDLHVSGHGSQEDIKTLFGILKPKYFIPVGGTIRHNRAYNIIAQSMGAKKSDIFELSPGESVEIKNGIATRGMSIPVKTVLVDGLGIGDVGNVVLRDRKLLAEEGIAVVHMQIDGSTGQLVEEPEIISRGFVFEKGNKGFLDHASRSLTNYLRAKGRMKRRDVQNFAVNYLERYFYDELGRRPMIVPVVVEV